MSLEGSGSDILQFCQRLEKVSTLGCMGLVISSKLSHSPAGFFFAPSAPPSQLDRRCAPPDVPLTTGSTLRLSMQGNGLCMESIYRRYVFRWGKGGLTHSVMTHHHCHEVGTRKKDPLHGSFFFAPSTCCTFGAPLPTGSHVRPA